MLILKQLIAVSKAITDTWWCGESSLCTPHARPFKLKAVCRCTFDWQRNDFLKTPVLFCLIFEHGKYSYARDDFLLFQACSQGSESSFRTSLAKFHVSILGQFFSVLQIYCLFKKPGWQANDVYVLVLFWSVNSHVLILHDSLIVSVSYILWKQSIWLVVEILRFLISLESVRRSGLCRWGRKLI